MKAMILAAGLGTRLRPLTDDRPKALVEIAGRTLLDIALSRLKASGVHEVIVNVHHFADAVVDYLRVHDNFGMHIEVSREETLLDTGGGLKKASWFFADEPFILHNVDVISSIDLARMVESHRANGSLVTLAVQQRETSRYLLFDQKQQLCGRRTKPEMRTELVRPAEHTQALAFCGIHVISPELFPLMHGQGAFSIITSYLDAAAAGQDIRALRADDLYWKDLGRPEHLSQAEADLKQGLIHFV